MAGWERKRRFSTTLGTWPRNRIEVELGLPPRWRNELIKNYCYVNDQTQLEVLPLELAVSSLDRLERRRDLLFAKFARIIEKNDGFQKRWLPLAPEVPHDLRTQGKYLETKANCTRLQNSPIYRVRALLNRLHRRGRVLRMKSRGSGKMEATTKETNRTGNVNGDRQGGWKARKTETMMTGTNRTRSIGHVGQQRR